MGVHPQLSLREHLKLDEITQLILPFRLKVSPLSPAGEREVERRGNRNCDECDRQRARRGMTDAVQARVDESVDRRNERDDQGAQEQLQLDRQAVIVMS